MAGYWWGVGSSGRDLGGSGMTYRADQDGAEYQAGWDDGVQDSMLRATQYERILQDLIAELRELDTALSERGQGILFLRVARIKATTRLREVDSE